MDQINGIKNIFNWPGGGNIISLADLFLNKKFKGETTLIWRTDILKKYHTPIVEGEKFVPEYVCCYQAAKEGYIMLKDELFYYFRYQEDGYTAKGIQL